MLQESAQSRYGHLRQVVFNTPGAKVNMSSSCHTKTVRKWYLSHSLSTCRNKGKSGSLILGLHQPPVFDCFQICREKAWEISSCAMMSARQKVGRHMGGRAVLNHSQTLCRPVFGKPFYKKILCRAHPCTLT